MKPNRVMRLLAILGALALILAACGNGDTTDTTEAPETTDATEAPETTDAPETTEAPAGPPEEGPLGAVTVAPGDPIEIRSLEAISGPVAFLGIPNERATQMAINDYGPIKGFDVNMGVGLDDLCSGEGGQAASQTIVADEQILGVIGTSCSGAAIAAIPLISGAGMVLVSPSNTSPALTSDLAGTAGIDYQPGYYRIAHNDLFQGRAVAEFVFSDLGLATAAAIHDGDSYTQGLAQAFADAFTELGGTVTLIVGVGKEDTDMTPVLSEVGQDSPEAIYVPIFQPAGDFVVQQFAGVAGLADTQLVGADGLLVSDFLAIPESEGMYFSGPDLAFGENANAVTGISANDFLLSYEAEFGEAPTAAFWAHAYDATAMLLASIDDVAVELDDGSLFIDRQALRDALSSFSGAGMTGDLACDEFGDCGAQGIQIVFHEDTSITDSTQLPVVFTFKGEIG